MTTATNPTARQLLADATTTAERVVSALAGEPVELLVASSIARGTFVSVCASPRAADIARHVLEAAGCTFTDRDIDPEDPAVVDFYSVPE